jgi:hypothetical protein
MCLKFLKNSNIMTVPYCVRGHTKLVAHLLVIFISIHAENYM